jgi:hypothetical protein
MPSVWPNWPPQGALNGSLSRSGTLQQELIETNVAKDRAVFWYPALREMLRGKRRGLYLWLDDHTPADEIDDVPNFSVAPHRKSGAGESTRVASDGFVLIEVVTGKMEDAASFQFEEIVRTFLIEFVHAKGPIDTEAGGYQKIPSFEFIDKVVDDGPPRHAWVVQQDGEDQNDDARIS